MLKNAKNCQRWSKTTFRTPINPFFCVRDHHIFLAKNMSHILAYVHAKFQTIWTTSYGSNLSICVKKQSFWDILASRSQTKLEISPKIGAKSKSSMIRSQPYITYIKSGTSVDVKVDVKNVTEGREGEGRGGKEGTRLSFLCGLLHRVQRLEIFSFYLNNVSTNIQKLEGTGGYGPLLLAPAEGVGVLRAPYQVGVIYCSN